MSEKVYISDPLQAPENTEVRRGKRGGYYYINRAEIPKEPLNESKELDSFLKEVDIKSNTEHNYSFIAGQVIKQKGTATRVNLKIIPEMFTKDYINIHNHPQNLPPSSNDILIFLTHRQSKSIITNPDGKIYILTKNKDTKRLTPELDNVTYTDIIQLNQKLDELIIEEKINTKNLNRDELVDYYKNKYNFDIEIRNIDNITKSDKTVYLKEQNDINKIFLSFIKDSKNSIDLINGIKAFISTYLSSLVTGKLINQYKETKDKIISNDTLDSYDWNVINYNLNNPYLWKAYRDLDIELSNRVNYIITEGISKSINPRLIRDTIMREITDLTKNRVQTIIRTELHNIANISKEAQYKRIDANNEAKYKWLSVPDHRRTTYCTRISDRTRNGVSLDELKKIIREESDLKVYSPARPYQPHINCRSTFIRIY